MFTQSAKKKKGKHTQICFPHAQNTHFRKKKKKQPKSHMLQLLHGELGLMCLMLLTELNDIRKWRQMTQHILNGIAGM